MGIFQEEGKPSEGFIPRPIPKYCTYLFDSGVSQDRFSAWVQNKTELGSTNGLVVAVLALHVLVQACVQHCIFPYTVAIQHELHNWDTVGTPLHFSMKRARRLIAESEASTHIESIVSSLLSDSDRNDDDDGCLPSKVFFVSFCFPQTSVATHK